MDAELGETQVCRTGVQLTRVGDEPVAEFALQFPAEQVRPLAERFSYSKDDAACLDAGETARARGSYTRDELILIADWKTSRSRSKVAKNSPLDVEKATARALATNDERLRMEGLCSLSGVEVPTASALLYFAFPDAYPILDVRALESLGYSSSRTTYSVDFWLRYLIACRELAARLGVEIRTLDKALWQASKELGA
jgi:hypothetical protein